MERLIKRLPDKVLVFILREAFRVGLSRLAEMAGDELEARIRL